MYGRCKGCRGYLSSQDKTFCKMCKTIYLKMSLEICKK